MSNDSYSHEQQPPVDSPTRCKSIPWSPAMAVAVALVSFVLSQIIGGAIAGMLPSVLGWDSVRGQAWLNSAGAQLVFVGLSYGLIVAAIVGFVRNCQGSLSALGVRRPKWADLGYGALGAVFYIAVYAVVISLITALVTLNVDQKQNIGFQQNLTSPLDLTFAFVSLVLIAPPVEEFVFRGFLFGSLRNRYRFVVAMVVTSIVFALPHMLEGQGGGLFWVGGIDTFVLSLVLCTVREKTGRIWAGVVIHMLKNSLAFVSLFFLSSH